MTNFAAIEVIKTILAFPFMTPRTKPSTSPIGGDLVRGNLMKIIMPKLFGDRAFRLVSNSTHSCKFTTLHCYNLVYLQHGGGNCCN